MATFVGQCIARTQAGEFRCGASHAGGVALWRGEQWLTSLSLPSDVASAHPVQAPRPACGPSCQHAASVRAMWVPACMRVCVCVCVCVCVFLCSSRADHEGACIPVPRKAARRRTAPCVQQCAKALSLSLSLFLSFFGSFFLSLSPFKCSAHLIPAEARGRGNCW
jgi:hypothetical protein